VYSQIQSLDNSIIYLAIHQKRKKKHFKLGLNLSFRVVVVVVVIVVNENNYSNNFVLYITSQP
jgi:hypothetical protein